MYKRFRIWNFPSEIRILLEKVILTRYFKECIDHFRSKKAFARYLNTAIGGIDFWIKKRGFIPLSVISKTINFTSISWKDLEKCIIAYKGKSTSKPVINPILPIKATPELFEIIAHLIFDGCVDKQGRPSYTNSRKELHENMKILVRRCFGDVYFREVENDSAAQLWFSKCISVILKSFYNVEFDSLKGYFPNETFSLPKNFSKGIIKAAVDDEGSIKENGITIKLKNKKLISQVRKCFIKVFGKQNLSEISLKRDECWEFTLKTDDLKRFSKEIKLSHSIKKEFLDYAVEKSKLEFSDYDRFPWNTKIKILRLVGDGMDSSKEIGRKLVINRSNIETQMRKLEKMNLVQIVKKNKNTFIWALTEEGNNFLKNWAPHQKDVKIKLPNWREEFNLPSEKASVILNEYGRFRLFWALERLFNSQSKIGAVFNVHRNTIGSWKDGNNSIPISTLNEMFKSLEDNGIDIVNEIKNNVQEIRYKNGIKLW